MKLEDFSYQIAMNALELLEKQYNYKISEKIKKEIAEAVVNQMDSLIQT